MSWSHSGNFIATGGGDNKVYVYEINWESIEKVSGDFEYVLLAESDSETGHQNDVNCVAFHPSTDLLVSISDD